MNGGRAVWVVRHAEREDNINENWRKLPSARGLTFDNSMLSKRGREQAKECAARFRDVNITNVFASPFDRTIEAASIIVADKKLLIKPEPGLCELLFCSDGTPGFWTSEKLKEKYPLDDTKYVPVFTKIAKSNSKMYFFLKAPYQKKWAAYQEIFSEMSTTKKNNFPRLQFRHKVWIKDELSALINPAGIPHKSPRQVWYQPRRDERVIWRF